MSGTKTDRHGHYVVFFSVDVAVAGALSANSLRRIGCFAVRS